MRVQIHKADWAIVWNIEKSQHVYQTDCDVVFDSSGILYVGDAYEGPEAETLVEGHGLMVMPGMVSIHCHLNGGNLATGLLEEVLDPFFYHSPMYTRKGPFWRSPIATPEVDKGRWFKAAMRHAMGELLASGVTTVVDIQGATAHPEMWLDELAEGGLRAYAAPYIQEAFWKIKDGRVLDYEWNPVYGQESFGRAQETIAAAESHSSRRLEGMVFPAQVDTCSADLMKAAKKLAMEQGLLFQTHCSQSAPEFHTMVRRTGKTPVQWMESLGLLDSHTILGHAIFLDHHSMLEWHTRSDLEILAKHEVTVAHCPLTFSRWGTCLENFGSYRDAGVRLAMGNDTGPHNMLEEIRCAFTQARVTSHAPADISMNEIFHAATVGGAQALGREDLGRLTPGAKADLVLVDLKIPQMQPGLDPLRSLVFVAAERAIRDVYVDGELVFADHQPLSFDWGVASADLKEALSKMVIEVSKATEGPTMEEIAPFSLPFR